MCGRYSLYTPVKTLEQTFDAQAEEGLVASYNIAPTQTMVMVRPTDEGRRIVPVKWGLVPSWSRDRTGGARMINARAETVREKPAFRAAFRSRRCLIPADAFYEWQTDGAQKQPFAFRMSDESLFAFAGLWEWHGNGDDVLETCTIITTEANEVVRPVHERMPVILEAQHYADWLDPKTPLDVAQMLCAPYDPAAMIAYPVSSAVNSPRNNSPACLEPIPA